MAGGAGAAPGVRGPALGGGLMDDNTAAVLAFAIACLFILAILWLASR